METLIEPMVQTPEERRAYERAGMLQGLYIHLLIYGLVNSGLFAINLLSRGEDGGWWFQWPLLTWGLGLVVHLVTVLSPVFSSQWVDDKAESLMRRR